MIDVFRRATTSIVRLVMPVAEPMVQTIKRLTGCRTYHVENAFVFGVLALVNVATDHALDPWKWIETCAVLMTFVHANISQRMEEQQAKEAAHGGEVSVECFRKLQPFFVGKETLWMLTFVHARLWGALVGVFIFLMFYPWREEWRKWHPV